MAIETALTTILQGLGLLGSGITYLIQTGFQYLGFNVPEWLIQIATILILIGTLFTVGRRMSKILLIITVAILVSVGSGLLSGLIQF